MKKTNNDTIEQALSMYKETVSPHTNCLQEILSQIPEKKIVKDRRAVRSPYIWLAVTEITMLFSIMLAIIPTLTKIINNPFYQIDKEVQAFETTVQDEDTQDALTNQILQ
jgi:hypothetical protein